MLARLTGIGHAGKAGCRAGMSLIDPDNLKLTDFMDLPTLQEIQDSFAAVAGVKARITDAEGNLLTQPAPTKDFLRRQRAIAEAAGLSDDGDGQGPTRAGAEYIAPSTVNNQRLGTIRVSAAAPPTTVDEEKLATLAAKLGLDPKTLKQSVSQLLRGRS